MSSLSLPDELTTADRMIVCPLCLASPGAPCRTRGLGRVTSTHSVRSAATRRAWRVGYREGLRFAVKYPETAARMIAREEARR